MTQAKPYAPFLDHLELLVGRKPIQWQGEERTRELLDQELARVFERIDSDELATKFRNWCPVEGAVAEDYKNRLLELSGEGQFVAGIRFKGGDVSHPFVDVCCRNFQLAPPALTKLLDVLNKEFGRFKPRTYRIYLPAEVNPDLGEPQIDQFLVAGEPKETDDQTLQQQGLRVAVPTHLDFYDKFRKEFLSYAAASPYGDELYPIDRSNLEVALAQGLIRILQDGDRVGGLLVAESTVQNGLEGHLITEEFLYENYRGRSLAVPFQKLFIAALAKVGSKLVFGTISSRNMASLKVAMRSGREIIGRWMFVPAR